MLKTDTFLNGLLSSSFDGILVFDAQQQVTHCNPQFCRIFEMRSEHLIGRSVLSALPFLADLAPKFKELGQGLAFSVKDKFYLRSQFEAKIYFHLNASPLRAESGESLGGWLTIREAQDTKPKERSFSKKRLKDALKAFDFSNDRLKNVINSTSDWIVAIDTNYRFILFNDRYKTHFENFTGKSIHLGKRMLGCLQHLPDYEARVKENWEKVLAGEEHQLIDEITLETGKKGYVEISFNTVKDRQGNIIGASQIIRDITKRMKTEEMWIASERRFSKVFQEAGVGCALIALGGSYQFVQINPAATKTTGYTHENLKTKTVKSITHPDDFEKELVLIAELISGKRAAYQLEKRIFHLSGEVLWISITVTLLSDAQNQPEFALTIFENITDRKIAQQQLEVNEEKLKNLLKEKLLLISHLEYQNEQLQQQEEELAKANHLLQQQNNDLAKTMIALRTSREKLKETLKVLDERNFELDQFVYRTSHDLRSPLSSILGLISLMKMEDSAANYADYVQRIEGRVGRLDEFIKSMLNFSRNHRAEIACEKINFDDIAKESVDELRFFKHFDTIQIKWEIENEAQEFYSDAMRIKILFANILANAVKYQDFTKENSYIYLKISINSYATTILFQDNGIGIAPDYLSNIYNMFYRATESAEGSGLGLYIVKQTVDKLKGKISLHSDGIGKGLTVQIEVPNNLVRREIPLSAPLVVV
jgi:PAS domain S-box-containing protein